MKELIKTVSKFYLIKINKINDLGQVYAKSESEKNIFVENAVIGDVAEVEIIKENSKFILAKIKNLIEPSKSRVKSPCKFFEKCGGCNFLNFEESFYQKTKKEILLNILHKNGILLNEENIEFHWLGKRSRRKINFQIDQNNSLGFFNKNSHQLVKIDDCLLVEKAISDLIPKLQKLLLIKDFNGPSDKHGMTNFSSVTCVVTPHLLRGPSSQIFSSVSVTLFDNSIDLIFKIKKQLNGAQKNLLINFAKENDLNISSEHENGEFKKLYQSTKNQIFINDLQLDLHSKIFIQATKSMLQIAIKKISEFVLENKNIKKTIDLYSGFGAYSFAISGLAQELHLVEGEEKMINLIKENATKLDLSSKIKVYQRDLFLNPIDNKELNNFDLIIINPPRNGALPQVEKIAKSKVANIVMISCNPLTFARDAKILLENGFVIENISAIDQFYSSAVFEIITTFQK